MKKKQFLLIFFLTCFALAALNHESLITKSASSTYQQSNLSASSTFGTSQSVSLNEVAVTGNLIVVAVSAYSDTSANIATLIDNFGNKYIKAVSSPATAYGKHFIGIWYAEDVIGGENFTITATSTSASAYITIAAHEYKGMEMTDVLDQVQSASGIGTTARTSLTPMTSQVEELVFGAFVHQEAGIVNANSGTGFTIRQAEVNGVVEPLITEDQFVQTQSGFEAALEWSAQASWNGVVATFKVKRASATPTPTTQAMPTPSPTVAPTLTALPQPVPPQGIPGASYTFTSFPIGPGGTDNIPHQLVRTKDDRVYIFGYQGQRSANIKTYWTTGAGIPSSSSKWSSTQVTEGELILSVDAVYDGDNTIHVLINTNTGNLKDYVFDTATNTFKSPYLISSGNPTVAGDYVGTSGLSGMMDTSKILHLAYWAGDNHIVYQSLSYAAATNTFTRLSGPTQLDTAGSSNHPALALSPLDSSISVAWVSEASNAPKILARTNNGGNWGAIETVSTTKPWTSTSAGINIDQGPSVVIDTGGARHLTYIEDYDNTGDYGRTHYVTNRGSSWVDTALPSYTHDPALALNSFGDVFIIGHGHTNNATCKSNLDMCVSKKNSDGSWSTPSLFATHPANGHFDSSPSVKWSVIGYNRPETVEFIFALIKDDYSNSTFYYGSVVNSAASSPSPTATPTATSTTTPDDTPIATPTPSPTITPNVIPDTPLPAVTSTATPTNPGEERSLTAQISNRTDDVNEDGSYFITNSSTLWFGNSSSNTASYTGLRFNNLQIPPGATIVSARLSVYSVQDSWISVEMKLAAEESSNSTTFSRRNLPSQRPLTTSQIVHSSSSPWQANTWYDLDEMAPVIQEIINRTDWHSGNSISIIMKGNGNSWGRKYVQAYDNSPGLAVKLVITYKY